MVEQRERLTLGTLVRFLFRGESVDLSRDKAAEGRHSPRGQNLGLTNRLPLKAEGQVLLHVFQCNTCVT